MMVARWRIGAVMAMVAMRLVLWTDGPLSAEPAPRPLVAVVVASNNYNIVQYHEMQKALQAKGIPFENVSTQLGRAQSGGHQVEIDYKLTQLDLDRYAAIVFLGGFGALDDLVDNPHAIELVRHAAGQGKVVGGS